MVVLIFQTLITLQILWILKIAVVATPENIVDHMELFSHTSLYFNNKNTVHKYA